MKDAVSAMSFISSLSDCPLTSSSFSFGVLPLLSAPEICDYKVYRGDLALFSVLVGLISEFFATKCFPGGESSGHS